MARTCDACRREFDTPLVPAVVYEYGICLYCLGCIARQGALPAQDAKAAPADGPSPQGAEVTS